MFHWLNPDARWLVAGSTYWQWVTSIVALCGWALFFHTRWHDRCEHCWRKGTVPVSGSVHRHCRKHALEHGTTHA